MADTRQTTNLLQPGALFLGKYVVERLLGKGGMGEVYLVKHKILETHFALKLLFPDIVAKNSQYVRRFVREAQLACKVRHENLIAVHDAGEENNLYYIIMDYVSGGSVRDYLRSGQIFLPGRALVVVSQVAKALQKAYEHKMVHRDIKPDNIMFTAEGNVKLGDLGIAKSLNEHDTLITMDASSVFGTPAYMSPEQARESSKVDCRADIYSLGVVLYEMLVGKPPYKGSLTQVLSQVLSENDIPDIRLENDNIPRILADLIADMTRKKLETRIATPKELLDRISDVNVALQGGRPITIPSTRDYGITMPTVVKEPVAEQQPKEKVHWGKVFLMFLFSVLILGLFGAGLFYAYRPDLREMPDRIVKKARPDKKQKEPEEEKKPLSVEEVMYNKQKEKLDKILDEHQGLHRRYETILADLRSMEANLRQGQVGILQTIDLREKALADKARLAQDAEELKKNGESAVEELKPFIEFENYKKLVDGFVDSSASLANKIDMKMLNGLVEYVNIAIETCFKRLLDEANACCYDIRAKIFSLVMDDEKLDFESTLELIKTNIDECRKFFEQRNEVISKFNKSSVPIKLEAKDEEEQLLAYVESVEAELTKIKELWQTVQGFLKAKDNIEELLQHKKKEAASSEYASLKEKIGAFTQNENRASLKIFDDVSVVLTGKASRCIEDAEKEYDAFMATLRSIELSGPPGAEFVFFSKETDVRIEDKLPESGKKELKHLPPGEYDIRARFPHYEDCKKSIVLGGNDEELHLSFKPLKYRLEVVSQGKATVKVVHGGKTVFEGCTNAEGHCEIPKLAFGSYTVRVSKELFFEEEKNIQLQDNERVNVVLREDAKAVQEYNKHQAEEMARREEERRKQEAEAARLRAEAARKKAEEEARLRAEAARKKAEEEARRRAETERRKLIADANNSLEELRRELKNASQYIGGTVQWSDIKGQYEVISSKDVNTEYRQIIEECKTLETRASRMVADEKRRLEVARQEQVKKAEAARRKQVENAKDSLKALEQAFVEARGVIGGTDQWPSLENRYNEIRRKDLETEHTQIIAKSQELKADIKNRVAVEKKRLEKVRQERIAEARKSLEMLKAEYKKAGRLLKEMPIWSGLEERYETILRKSKKVDTEYESIISESKTLGDILSKESAAEEKRILDEFKKALLEARKKDMDKQLNILANLSEEAKPFIGDLPQWKEMDKEVQALKAMDVSKEYVPFTEKAEELQKRYEKIIEGDARTWKELENRMNASNRLANSSWNRELLRQLHENAQERLDSPRQKLQASQRRKLQKETEEIVSAMEMVADESVKLLDRNKISQLVNINQKRDKVCQYLAHCADAYLELEDANLKHDVKGALLGPIGQRKADFARIVKGSLNTNAKKKAYEQLMKAFENLDYVLNNNKKKEE